MAYSKAFLADQKKIAETLSREHLDFARDFARMFPGSRLVRVKPYPSAVERGLQ